MVDKQKKNKYMQDVRIFSHVDFDDFCEKNNFTDSNIEEMDEIAIISIIGTPEVLEYYLQEPHTEHWFKNNHDNVLNLEFDDVSEDRVFEYKNGLDEITKIHAFTITDEQAKQIVDFIEKNIGKTFLIHCKAGFSRSPAVGRFIIDYYEEYNKCKGREYVDRVRPNVEVVSKLKKMWREKHNYGKIW